MKALITGINGSGPSYLAEYLLDIGLNVAGISRWHSTTTPKNLAEIYDRLEIYDCDLNDLSAIIRTLKKCRPDYIFNMAAHANVHVCFTNPIAVLENNIRATHNLLEGIRLSEIDCILVHASTSEIYGKVTKEEIPITENQLPRPQNVYAVSKLAQEQLCFVYHSNFRLNTIVTRAFTYICPRRNDIFSSAFAQRIVDVERGKSNSVKHGNLDSIRTIIDVRDIAESYLEAARYGFNGEAYNIGGQATLTVGHLLNLLVSRAKCSIQTELDPSLVRPTDVTLQIPDTSKFSDVCNDWKPKISLENSLDFLMDHYRNDG